jgi:hypothetical protein
MNISPAARPIVRLALVWTLIAAVTACQAQSVASLDKHARKIHHRLSKYAPGTYLNIELRNGTGTAGDLATLTDASFTISNEENNTPETHGYAEVAKVWRGKEYIGAGSESGHHIRLWIPVVAGVLAGGAVAAALTVR